MNKNNYIFNFNKFDPVGDSGCLYISEANSSTKRRMCLFQCKCGNEFTCRFESVRSGSTKSCGCRKIIREPVVRKPKKEKVVYELRSMYIKYESGFKFGDLTYLRDAEYKYNKRKGVFMCKCGKEFTSVMSSVKSGKTKSCGCYKLELLKNKISPNKTHGLSQSSEFHTWSGLKARCFNKKIEQYKNYGGRNISVCDSWLSRFENFLSDMGLKDSPDLSLERLDVNGNYEPSNCIWADIKTQANNRRSNLKITFQGETMNAIKWAERYNLHPSIVVGRYRRGWDIEKIFTTPIIDPKKHYICYNGENLHISEWSKKKNIHTSVLQARIKLGWEPYDILNIPTKIIISKPNNGK